MFVANLVKIRFVVLFDSPRSYSDLANFSAESVAAVVPEEL